MPPRVLILRAPGTNCDGETAFAFQTAGAQVDVLHVQRLREHPALVAQYQVLCIPGGFSYGDDIAAGRILGNQIRHHLADAIQQFRDAGKLILGICNGLQILIKSGVLLPDLADSAANNSAAAGAPQAPATLTWNDSGKFEDRWVNLAVRGDKCVFLRGIERMYLPVAHAEGKFITRDADTLGRLDQNGQLALRYVDAAGRSDAVPYPQCPNGSQLLVAGLCDDTGRVFGLMPHPERHLDPTHHPRWTRGEAGPVGDGLAVFVNAVRYFG
ncbi:MAG: phosphoribosylformylglycinamidine synthase I [Planctomycetia bacterium]|nr:phosphoribosylformylglycinamidine synthase I [Planctomycetia bacterium]